MVDVPIILSVDEALAKECPDFVLRAMGICGGVNLTG